MYNITFFQVVNYWRADLIIIFTNHQSNHHVAFSFWSPFCHFWFFWTNSSSSSLNDKKRSIEFNYICKWLIFTDRLSTQYFNLIFFTFIIKSSSDLDESISSTSCTTASCHSPVRRARRFPERIDFSYWQFNWQLFEWHC